MHPDWRVEPGLLLLTVFSLSPKKCTGVARQQLEEGGGRRLRGRGRRASSRRLVALPARRHLLWALAGRELRGVSGLTVQPLGEGHPG